MTSSRSRGRARPRHGRHSRPAAGHRLGRIGGWLRAARLTLVAAAVVAGTGAAFAYGLGARHDRVPPPAAVPALAAAATPASGLTTFPVAPATGGPVQSAIGPSASAAIVAVDARAEGLAADGIPRTALEAYQDAATREAMRRPECHLPWELPAAIGRVESDHGRFGNATLYSNGISKPPIIGIPLDGNGTALIRDTDHGALDGDTVYDRAVGPMQFIPSTWATYGVDADGDGKADPFDIFDAAATTGDYLCAAGGDLALGAGQRRAVSAYNHSNAYVELVLRVERVYSDGAIDFGTPSDPPPPPPAVPPAAPGPPLAAGGPDPTPVDSSTVTVTARPGPPTSTPPGASSSGLPTSGPGTSGPPDSSRPSSPPDTGAPSSAAPTSDQPTSDAPTSDEPSSDQPATEQAASAEPAADQPSP